MKDLDDFDIADEPEAVTSTVADEKPHKKLGRPKGAKNKFSSDARALLARHGPAAIRQLCKIAAGQCVSRWPAGGGAREQLTPSIRDMLTAQQIIIDRMVPTLRSSELTGADGAALIPKPDTVFDIRQTAIAMLSIAREASLRPVSATQSAPPARVIDEQQVLAPAPSGRTAHVRFRG